ncbi:uncharacterized protein N7459_006111 [Penicillium hispanicum]|uniref:uncharacterized protein n=1 Tax=Penicillium hispanicum TaxID=1080232 RepID=UPI00254036E7|nr:uncharacterized protein N7459_006111 [Penicillium hispanicum]KAJ5580126.1 hypothetical protein N7459_006111 [Penicillium hispanicum]
MSLRSPRGRSPLRSPDDLARSHSLRSRTPRQDSRPRSITRSPSLVHDADYRDRHTRSHSRSSSRGRSRSRSRGGRRYRTRSYSRTPSPNPSPPRSAKIVVERLTKNVTENHLREIFGSFGDIEYLDLPMNRACKVPILFIERPISDFVLSKVMTNRGTAYILYYDPADAEAAIAHMHEAQLDGAILNVSIILPRRTFSRSPPPVSNRNGGRSRFGKGPFAKSPPRRYGRARAPERHDVYRPQSLSRPPSRSYSRSRSPHRRGSLRPDSPRQRRRRSPSYSSYGYSSRSDRSRSPNRSHSRNRH